MSAILYRARGAARRRWRAWVGLAVVLGAFAGVTLALAEAARRSVDAYPTFVRTQHAADLVMAGNGGFGFVGSYDLDRIVRLPGVRSSAAAFVALPFSARVDGNSRELGAADLFPVASTDDRLGSTVERWKILDGRAADPSRVEEATASFELANRLDLHVGSTIRFKFYDAKNFGAVAVSLYQGWPKRLDALRRGDEVAVKDPADGPVVEVRVVGIEASPLEFPPLITDLAPVLHLTTAFERAYSTRVVGSPVGYIRLERPDALSGFQLAVENLSNQAKAVSFISTLGNQEPKVQRSIRAEALVLAALALIVGFAGAISLAQALTRQAYVEARDDETLRALGMSRPHLFAVAMIRSGVIALVAAAVACLIGWLAAPSLMLSLARKADLQTGFPVDVRALLLGAAAVFVFTMAVGAVAALLAGRAADRARVAERTPVRRSRVSAVLGQPWLPVPAALGIRFAVQRGRRSLPAWSAIAGVAACIAMLTFASTFIAHLRRDLSEKDRYGWNWDVKIGAPALPELGDSLVPGLRAQPGLTDLSVGAVTQMDIAGKRYDVLALDVIVGNAQPTVIAGRAPLARDEIALGGRTTRDLHTAIGRDITARIGARDAVYHVVGRAVFPEFGDNGQLGTGAWTTVGGLTRIASTKPPRDTFFIRWGPGIDDRPERVAVLSEVLSPLPAHLDARPEDLVNLSRGGGLTVVLAALLGLLALAMLVHALVTSVRGGRRSHATLRALGYSRRQSFTTMVWQSCTLAAAALVVGLPLGLAVGRVVWSAYAGRLGLTTDVFVPVGSVALACVGALVVALLASIPPGWLVTRGHVAPTLRAQG